MVDELITQSIQDYLKAIYELCKQDGTANTKALASRLGVTPPSVTGMLQRLAGCKPPLVIYYKHRGATLTADGEIVALEVIRHHRLIETYLVKTLGYKWDQVHEEADRLEHFISEDFETRIATLLGNPVRDPHGELIPTADLIMPPDNTKSLSLLVPKQKACIVRVRANDLALLRHLENLGLTPGTNIEVVERSPIDNKTIIRVGIKETNLVVDSRITDSIFISF